MVSGLPDEAELTPSTAAVTFCVPLVIGLGPEKGMTRKEREDDEVISWGLEDHW